MTSATTPTVTFRHTAFLTVTGPLGSLASSNTPSRPKGTLLMKTAIALFAAALSVAALSTNALSVIRVFGPVERV